MLNIEKVVIGVLLSVVAFQVRICVANERDLRESFAAEVARALAEEDFARLEGMSATFRRERARTPAGTWKLTLMYDALVRHSNYTSADERFWTDKEQRFTNWLCLHRQGLRNRESGAR